MKLTKTEFKSMIKECIRELVKEGAFNEVLTEEISNAVKSNPRVASNDMVSKKNPVDVARARSLAARMAGYNEFSGNSEEVSDMPMNENLKKLIETTSSQMSKGDSKAANAYAAILADTAINTLPQQMAQDPSRNGGYGAMAAAGMQGVQEKVAPQELQAIAPSGDVSHWAKLAFGKYNK
jgi:hypothetical protein